MAISGKKGSKLNKTQRGGPRSFSEGLDRDNELLSSSSDSSSESNSEDSTSEESSNEEIEIITKKVDKVLISTKAKDVKQSFVKKEEEEVSSKPKELTRKEKEMIQHEQNKQHYLKMKAKEDAERLKIIRKKREDDALNAKKDAEEKEKERISGRRA